LAQYRDLAAFAQFGSDLDESTKKQLDLGVRTSEILKQGQYQPMSVEQQVAIIYAVINGLLDDVEVDKVRDFEDKFHKYLETQAAEVLAEMAKTKDLGPETEAKLKTAIADFKQGYK
jgi:F-type H+/Na+-transporting ATPase subunit alpha